MKKIKTDKIDVIFICPECPCSLNVAIYELVTIGRPNCPDCNDLDESEIEMTISDTALIDNSDEIKIDYEKIIEGKDNKISRLESRIRLNEDAASFQSEKVYKLETERNDLYHKNRDLSAELDKLKRDYDNIKSDTITISWN